MCGLFVCVDGHVHMSVVSPGAKFCCTPNLHCFTNSEEVLRFLESLIVEPVV